MTTKRRSTRTRLLTACTAGVLLLAACGGSDDAAEPDAADTPDTEVAADSETDQADQAVSDEAVSDAAVSDEAVSGDAAAIEVGTVDFVPGTQLVPYDPTVADPAVGVASPVVDGQRFDGSAITIGGPTDGPTMYVFLAHWCPHCNDEVPVLIDLNDSGALPADLDLVGISTAAAPDRDNYPPSEWLESRAWPWDAMADDDTLTAMNVFGGNSFPFAVLVDADGTVLARKAGSSSGDQILEWITAGLATASA